jgi:hypothetical protein
MVLDLAAVWQCDPNKTKFAEFPKLWQDALELVAADKAEIYEALSVNPSMVPNQSSKHKMSQAEVANVQQVDVLTTADVVTAFEGSVLTPLIQRFFWYDMQFRKKELAVKMFGRAGLKAQMQTIPPIQMNNKYWFKWLGVEQARTAQQQQQQIAFANVLLQLPPQAIPGRRIDIAPLIEKACESIFGASMAPLIFHNLQDQLGIDPQEENKMLAQGFDLPTSPFDNDMEHMQIHAQLLQSQGDPSGMIRVHMQKHQMQMAQKRQQAQQSQQPMQPGQGGAGPKPGAQTSVPRQQGPNGMIHPDQLHDSPPRNM